MPVCRSMSTAKQRPMPRSRSKTFRKVRRYQYEMMGIVYPPNADKNILIAVIMIPNVVFAIKCKDGFDNKWNNKYVEVTEQVGRLGCFGFMIINIPGTWFGWWSDEAFALYLIVDTILVMLYCAIWIICFKKNSVFRALALSIIPSMLFLFSGIMSRSVLLIIASVLFAPSHIERRVMPLHCTKRHHKDVISYKNVSCETATSLAPCKYVIHAVGPRWRDGKHGEREKLVTDLAGSRAYTAIRKTRH